MDALHEERLVTDDVTDARERALVEQRLTDGELLELLEVGDRNGDVEGRSEQVRAKRGHRLGAGQAHIGQELDGWAVEADRHRARRAEDHGGSTLGQAPRLASAVSVPRTGHAQVGAQCSAMLALPEDDEQVLAPRLDCADPQPGQ